MSWRWNCGTWPSRVCCWIVCWVALCWASGLAADAPRSGRNEAEAQGSGEGETPSESLVPRLEDRLTMAGREATKHIERGAGGLAVYLDRLYDQIAQHPSLQWPAFALGLLAGGVFLLLGWALLRAFFVPTVALAGLVSGGFLGLGAGVALGAGKFLVASAAAGMLAGGALCMFVAKKGKPLGVLLVVFMPFLVLSCALFPFSLWAGLTAFGLGVLLGCVCTVRMRTTVVVGTSVLGATALMISWRILAGALAGGPVTRSLRWLLEHPLALLAVFCVVLLFGITIQMSAGPGELEREDLGLGR